MARKQPTAANAGPFAPSTDGYRMIIALLMIMTISRIHQNFRFLNPFHPATLLVGLAGLYAMMNPRLLGTEVAMKTREFKLIIAMAIMSCLSVPFGISMGGSAEFILTEFSKVIVFALLVLFGIRNSRDLYRFIWGFVVAAGCLAYLSIFVFRMMAAKGDDFVRIQSGFTYDSNDIGLVAGLGVVITLLGYAVGDKKTKLACIAVLGALGMTIAKTGSRGAIVTLGVIVIGLMFVVRTISTGKKLAFLGVMFVGIVISTPEGYWEQMATILTPTQDYNWTSETGRVDVALRGLGYMMMNPATGIGVGNFGKAEGLLSDRAIAFKAGESDVGIKWSAAHNSYIEAAAEMGLPGILILLLMIWGSAWECFKLKKRMKGWDKGDAEQRFLYNTAAYLPVAFAAFGTGGALVSFAYMDPIYVLVAYVGGLRICVEQRLRQDAVGGPAGAAPAAPAPRRYRGGLPPLGVAPNPQPQPVPRS